MKRCKSTVKLLTAGCVAAVLLSGCATAPAPENSERATAVTTTLTAAESRNYKKSLESIQKGQPEKAVAGLKKLTNANPRHVGLWVNLAVACYKAGDFKHATEAMTQATTLNDKVPELNNLAGLIAIDQGQYALAEKDYLQAITLNENYADAHYNLALLYDIFYQDIAKALVHYERYLTLIDDEDPTTKSWTDELKRTLKSRDGR